MEKNNLGVGNVSKPTVRKTFLTFIRDLWFRRRKKTQINNIIRFGFSKKIKRYLWYT